MSFVGSMGDLVKLLPKGIAEPLLRAQIEASFEIDPLDTLSRYFDRDDWDGIGQLDNPTGLFRQGEYQYGYMTQSGGLVNPFSLWFQGRVDHNFVMLQDYGSLRSVGLRGFIHDSGRWSELFASGLRYDRENFGLEHLSCRVSPRQVQKVEGVRLQGPFPMPQGDIPGSNEGVYLCQMVDFEELSGLFLRNLLRRADVSEHFDNRHNSKFVMLRLPSKPSLGFKPSVGSGCLEREFVFCYELSDDFRMAELLCYLDVSPRSNGNEFSRIHLVERNREGSWIDSHFMTLNNVISGFSGDDRYCSDMLIPYVFGVDELVHLVIRPGFRVGLPHTFPLIAVVKSPGPDSR